MSSYSHNSSYNRTYEKKVLEEVPRVRISHPFAAAHVIPATFGSLPSAFGMSTASSLRTTDDSFHASIDVREYAPEDLKVSVVGQQIIVEGSHPEKTDELGQIQRSFVRKFALPPSVQPDAVQSNLTSDGVLTIVALPPKPKEASPARSIPVKVVATPQPSPAN